jgi:hypothetical protein
VKTGIQYFQVVTEPWTPVFTGVTTFYETINIERYMLGSIQGFSVQENNWIDSDPLLNPEH